MIDYTIYETATGEIVQTGSTPQPDMLPLFLSDGQSYLLKSSDPMRQRVSAAGRLISKPAANIKKREDTEALRALRARRSQLLAASDWTQVADAPVDQEAWKVYRQKLRDLPANTTDPRNPDWPEAPE